MHYSATCVRCSGRVRESLLNDLGVPPAGEPVNDEGHPSRGRVMWLNNAGLIQARLAAAAEVKRIKREREEAQIARQEEKERQAELVQQRKLAAAVRKQRQQQKVLVCSSHRCDATISQELFSAVDSGWTKCAYCEARVALTYCSGTACVTMAVEHQPAGSGTLPACYCQLCKTRPLGVWLHQRYF